jgi:hypothetical protein
VGLNAFAAKAPWGPISLSASFAGVAVSVCELVVLLLVAYRNLALPAQSHGPDEVLIVAQLKEKTMKARKSSPPLSRGTPALAADAREPRSRHVQPQNDRGHHDRSSQICKGDQRQPHRKGFAGGQLLNALAP